ncbi:hypothetical protein I79_006912 [Cricetulus griseus]|uniref:Uncharacterized protein n=1 Tax=Cricetulus griseus TaxID=10029 RepID=G3H950_CRIGR|nr:hypothetical protein I79_006912 [Cricetulus griseus]
MQGSATLNCCYCSESPTVQCNEPCTLPQPAREACHHHPVPSGVYRDLEKLCAFKKLEPEEYPRGWIPRGEGMKSAREQKPSEEAMWSAERV